MRSAILAAAALAALGGAARGADDAFKTYSGCVGAFGVGQGCVYPADPPPLMLDGRVDWREATKRAAGPPTDQNAVWNRALLAARLDGWRAAGREGEPR